MALYWPDANVALEVVDDPTSTPFVGSDSVEVICISGDDLEDPGFLDALIERLSRALDKEPPKDLDGRTRERWLRSLVQRAQVS